MANSVLVYKNHITVIESLICITLEYASLLSEFLSNNIQSNFTECINSTTDSKRNRIIDNIYSNIDKLSKREEKKVCAKEIVKLINEASAKLDYFRKEKYIDNKYMKKILEIFDNKSLSCILTLLFDEYVLLHKTVKKESNRNINRSISKNEIETSRKTLENLVDQIKSKKSFLDNYNNSDLEIELPKVKKIEPKINPDINVRSLVMLHDGRKYMYFNIEKIGTNKYRFDIDSFSAEEDLYLKALIENRNEVFSEMILLDNEVTLAPFEKRRMQFIQNMYDMERGLEKLNNKSIDITTTLDKYYQYAKSIVDNYYLQIMNEDSDINALNTLMHFTRISYGASRQYENYKKVSSKFLEKYNKVPSYVTKELLINSYTLKSKIDYSEFRHISNVIPSDEDIIKILNRRLINEVSSNILKYISDISFYIDRVSVYMNVDDLVDLYLNARNSLNRNGLKNPSVNEKDFVKLQRKICEVICRKLGNVYGNLNDYRDELFKICNEVLHEGPLFVVDRFEVLSDEYKHKKKIEDDYKKIAYRKYESDISEWNKGNSLDKFISKYDK